MDFSFSENGYFLSSVSFSFYEFRPRHEQICKHVYVARIQ